jgi:arsenate reductase
VNKDSSKGIQLNGSRSGSDEDKQRAYLKAYTELHRRISLFVNLPLDKFSKLSLQEKLDEIGRTQ